MKLCNDNQPEYPYKTCNLPEGHSGNHHHEYVNPGCRWIGVYTWFNSNLGAGERRSNANYKTIHRPR